MPNKKKKSRKKESSDTATVAEKPSPKKKSTTQGAVSVEAPVSIPLEKRVDQIEQDVARIGQVLTLLDKKLTSLLTLTKSPISQREPAPSEPPEGTPLYDPKRQPAETSAPTLPTPPSSSGGIDLGGLDLGTITELLKSVLAPSNPEPQMSMMDKAIYEEIIEATRKSIKTRLGLADMVLEQFTKGKLKFEVEE